jgi:hypothetical protein
MGSVHGVCADGHIAFCYLACVYAVLYTSCVSDFQTLLFGRRSDLLVPVTYLWIAYIPDLSEPACGDAHIDVTEVNTNA